jgi:RecA-family ATPase
MKRVRPPEGAESAVVMEEFHGHAHGPAITTSPWWCDPATIPPRQFLFGRHYIRGAVGATIAAGGRGKTTLGLFEAASMSSGRDLRTGHAIATGPLRVWAPNGEEDKDEIDRRLAAVCQHYGITRADLGGRLFAQSVRDQPMHFATMVKGVPTLNEQLIGQCVDFITEHKIDVFMVDPLVSFHTIPENDNGAMDLLVKRAFGSIARQTKSAAELFHHPGKPKQGQSETSVEDGRGASAILWAVRSARVLNFMTPDEATKLGIPDEERIKRVRIANGKANMGPLGKAIWFALEVENLPNGDEVAVASPWSPPDPFDSRHGTGARTGAHWRIPERQPLSKMVRLRHSGCTRDRCCPWCQ